MVTTERAARLLGVKRETLYAYASRGLLRRVPMGRGRRQGYLLSDVERLKARSQARSGHGPVASSALRWGEPVLDSAITRIDVTGGPVYRGHAAIALAEADATFEEVASLLWQSDRPAPWTPLRRGRAPAGSPLDGFARTIASLGLDRRAMPGDSREIELDRAGALIITLAGARSRGPGVARALLESLGTLRPTDRAVRALDRALVLSADHELNPSTFAARVAAGAGAGLYACLIAALATLSGARHGGEADRVEAMLADVRSASDARRLVARRTEHGDLLPGFGHPLYPGGDPRGPVLLAAARELEPASSRAIDAVVREVERTLGLKPNLDVGLAALARAIGAPGAGSAIFALGRCAGWTAHVLEQREAGFILRPRARYVGV